MTPDADQLLDRLRIQPTPEPDEAKALAIALAQEMPTVALTHWQRQALREGVDRWPA